MLTGTLQSPPLPFAAGLRSRQQAVIYKSGSSSLAPSLHLRSVGGVSMKPHNQNVGHDPTIMGNEKPRRDHDDDNLPKGDRVQHQDPRNGVNRPVDTGRPVPSGEDRNEK